MNTIGVGIIGGSQGGWASISHIPALKALPDFELRAVSTSRQESANAAGKEFGVEAAFDNHADLLAHPGVDVVVVAVKVPHHRELISAAIDAGKTVYAEWPLALNLAEATELTRRAEAAGFAPPSACRAATTPNSASRAAWSRTAGSAESWAPAWWPPAWSGAGRPPGPMRTGTTGRRAPLR